MLERTIWKVVDRPARLVASPGTYDQKNVARITGHRHIGQGDGCGGGSTGADLDLGCPPGSGAHRGLAAIASPGEFGSIPEEIESLWVG